MAAGLLIVSVVISGVAAAVPRPTSDNPALSNAVSEDFPYAVIDLYPYARAANCGIGEYENPATNECETCINYGKSCEKDYNSDEQCCYSTTSMICKEVSRHSSKCLCKNDNMVFQDGICLRDYSSSLQFMTAAQIALGVALVISVAALTALTCKMCSNRRRMDQVAQEFQRGSINTASLNSVQRFVLGRLRDRPPRYDDVPDKPPEYEQEPEAELTTLPMPRIPAAAASRIPGRRFRLPPSAPPAYAEIEPVASSSSSSAADTQPVPPDAAAEPESVAPAEPAVAESEQPQTEQTAEEPVSSISAPGTDEHLAGVDNPAFSLENECHM